MSDKYSMSNGDKQIRTKTNIQKIIYHFEDSSVPPEYHRSVEITVTPEKAKIIVESYGDILTKKEYKINKSQFDNIIQSIKNNEIRNLELGEHRDCIGGTTDSLSFSDGKKEIFAGSVYHCGGIDSGNLGGNVKNFVEKIKILIPKLQKLLK